MSKTTVEIKKKTCGPASEINEEIAKKLYNKKGTRILAIVELKSDKTHEGLDGDRQVDCIISSIEPVVDGNLNGEVTETVRRLHRALAINRERISPKGDVQLSLDENEPTVEGVLGAAAALIETDEETGEPTGIWDGDPDDTEELHIRTDLPPAPEDDLEDATVDDEAPDPDDRAYDTHLFEGDAEACTYADCGQPRTAAIHSEVPALT